LGCKNKEEESMTTYQGAISKLLMSTYQGSS